MNSAIQELKKLALYEVMQKYPNMPYPVAPKFKATTANGLTRCIVRYIQLRGGQAERISITGRPVDGRKVVTDCMGFKKQIGSVSWMRSNMTPGTADISATIKGRSIKIEVKIGHDRMSEAQKRYRDQVEASGGIYYVAKDFESFYRWFNQTFGN